MFIHFLFPDLAPVDQKWIAIQWINPYPLDNAIMLSLITYQLDDDLSGE